MSKTKMEVETLGFKRLSKDRKISKLMRLLNIIRDADVMDPYDMEQDVQYMLADALPQYKRPIKYPQKDILQWILKASPKKSDEPEELFYCHVFNGRICVTDGHRIHSMKAYVTGDVELHEGSYSPTGDPDIPLMHVPHKKFKYNVKESIKESTDYTQDKRDKMKTYHCNELEYQIYHTSKDGPLLRVDIEGTWFNAWYVSDAANIKLGAKGSVIEAYVDNNRLIGIPDAIQQQQLYLVMGMRD